MPLKDSSGNLISPHKSGLHAYEYDHFSGSNIVVMLGDVVIDNAVAISFSVEQTKTPVYGYASQYYSFVADGHVFVQGSLTIAFKEAGYLLWPIQRFRERAANAHMVYDELVSGEEYPGLQTSPRYSVDENGNLINTYSPSKQGYSLTAASKAAKRKQVMKANVEQMLDWEASGTQGRQNYQYNKFWKKLEALEDNNFENWAEAFEDAIWYGSDISNPLVREKLFSKNISETETFSNAKGVAIPDEEILSHRRVDQNPQIDVWVVYGDMSRQPANHTVRKLLDLSFTGQSQTIEPSGQPIYETYSFIARNLV